MEWIVESLAGHSREDEITTKLLKPVWVRAADVLLLCLFSISVMEAGLKIELDTFSCNINECVYNMSQYSLQSCPQFQTLSLDADSVYSYIDDKCRQKMIPWFLENIALIYLINAAILFTCSRLWTSLPSSALYIERFVGMVSECNDAIGTFACAFDVIFKTHKEAEQFDDFSDAHDYASDPAKLQALLKLYRKVLAMSKDVQNTEDKDKIPQQNFDICVVCKVQYTFLTLLSLMGFFCISWIFFWFNNVRYEYYCDLEEYSRITCVHRLYAIDWFLAVMYCTCNCLHCLLSSAHLCWLIRKCGIPYRIDFPESHSLQITGSLGLLLHLLRSNDKFFVQKFCLFMDNQAKEKIEERTTNKLFTLKKMKTINEYQDGLRLKGLKFKPKSFNYLHCIPNLTVLRLVDCNLKEFPTCILSAVSLVEVSLANNHIRNIPNQTRKDKSGILELVLDKNPLLPVTIKNIQSWKELKSVSLVGINTEQESFSFIDEHWHAKGCKMRELAIDTDSEEMTRRTILVEFICRCQLQYARDNVFLRIKRKQQLLESLKILKSTVRSAPNTHTDSGTLNRLEENLGKLEEDIEEDVDDETILYQFVTGVKELGNDVLDEKLLKEIEDDMEASYTSIYRYLLENQDESQDENQDENQDESPDESQDENQNKNQNKNPDKNQNKNPDKNQNKESLVKDGRTKGTYVPKKSPVT